MGGEGLLVWKRGQGWSLWVWLTSGCGLSAEKARMCVSVLLCVSAFVLGRAPQRVGLKGLVGEGISALK